MTAKLVGMSTVAPVSAAVVVPSFGRPELLAACLAALAAQSRPPDEVLVVGRHGDEEAAAAVATAALPARFLTVATPGHLPPLKLGVQKAGADVVCIVDDDAEPWPEWLARLLPHYEDAGVGGVGGRVDQPRLPVTPTDRIGIIGPGGRFDCLNLERPPLTPRARRVHVLRGTNMSFRRSVLGEYVWDARLNGGAATDYEVDLCGFVRRQGLAIVYEPLAGVTHHLGERPELGREQSAAAIRAYSHNQVYVAGKALPPLQAVPALARLLVVGNRAAYGPAAALADALLGRPPSLRRQLLPALRGKLAGLGSLVALAREGPERLDWA